MPKKKKKRERGKKGFPLDSHQSGKCLPASKFMMIEKSSYGPNQGQVRIRRTKIFNAIHSYWTRQINCCGEDSIYKLSY